MSTLQTTNTGRLWETGRALLLLALRTGKQHRKKQHLLFSQTEKSTRMIFSLEKSETLGEPRQRGRPQDPRGSDGQHRCARGLGTAATQTQGHRPSNPNPSGQDGRTPRATAQGALLLKVGQV